MSEQPFDGDMMRQAQKIWTMLDDMAESDPQSYRKFIDKQIKEGKEMMKPPEPHMCVQTRLHGGEDDLLYMNIFAWQRVPPPKNYDVDPIPVIGGPIMCDSDKKHSFKTVSLAFNPRILEDHGKTCRIEEQQQALINLAIDYVQDTQKVSISRNYCILGNNVVYKGNIEKARLGLTKQFKDADENYEAEMENLQKNFAPMASSGNGLLNELSNITVKDNKENVKGPKLKKEEPEIRLPTNSKPTKTGLIQELSSSGDAEEKKPKYEMNVKDREGSKKRRVVVRIELPYVTSVRECDLDISEDDLTLVVQAKYDLKLKLPEKILENEAQAKFSTKSHSLTVTLPTKKQ